MNSRIGLKQDSAPLSVSEGNGVQSEFKKSVGFRDHVRSQDFNNDLMDHVESRLSEFAAQVEQRLAGFEPPRSSNKMKMMEDQISKLTIKINKIKAGIRDGDSKSKSADRKSKSKTNIDQIQI